MAANYGDSGAVETMAGFWQQVVDVWTSGLFGIGVGEVLLALMVFFVFLFARRLFSRFIIRAVRTLTKRTATEIDDKILAAVEDPLRFVFVVVGVYAPGRWRRFPTPSTRFSTSWCGR